MASSGNQLIESGCLNLSLLKSRSENGLCSDFSNLNQACTKDSFLLPQIDQLVDSTAIHEVLSFVDTYLGCNQIPMYPADEEHTSFITNKDIYCYKMMPFGLKKCKGHVLKTRQ